MISVFRVEVQSIEEPLCAPSDLGMFGPVPELVGVTRSVGRRMGPLVMGLWTALRYAVHGMCDLATESGDAILQGVLFGGLGACFPPERHEFDHGYEVTCLFRPEFTLIVGTQSAPEEAEKPGESYQIGFHLILVRGIRTTAFEQVFQIETRLRKRWLRDFDGDLRVQLVKLIGQFAIVAQVYTQDRKADELPRAWFRLWLGRGHDDGSGFHSPIGSRVEGPDQTQITDVFIVDHVQRTVALLRVSAAVGQPVPHSFIRLSKRSVTRSSLPYKSVEIRQSPLIQRVLLRAVDFCRQCRRLFQRQLLGQKGNGAQRIGRQLVLLGAVAAISLLVGGIGVMNIMLVSVLERTREIGIRKALGARDRDIWSQFLFEAALLTFTGGIIGVIIGWGLSILIDTMGLMTTVVSVNIVFLAVGVAIAIGLFFGFYPAWNASRLNPIEALRSE